jgi:S1-C subfamily serine protease
MARAMRVATTRARETRARGERAPSRRARARAATRARNRATRDDGADDVFGAEERFDDDDARGTIGRAVARVAACAVTLNALGADAALMEGAEVGWTRTRTTATTTTTNDARDDDASAPEGRYRTYIAPDVPLGDAAVRLPMPAREAKRDGAYKTVQATQRFTDGERETVRLFNNAKASVVYITNVAVRRDAFTLDLTEQPQGAGSGIVWDDKGHIVTNYHVIDKANQLKVSFLPNKGGVQNQKTYDAAIVGFDDDKDIAVLQVNDPEALREMKPLVIGTSGDSMVGQRVFAIGNPFGLDHTLTTGIISGLGREIQSGNTGRPIDGIIQTDAAINPGNSGGPLLNSSGQLIGINTAIYSASGTSSGVGFALPSDMVSGIVDQIIRYGRVTRPILGVSFAPDGALDQLGLGGVLVLDARAGGPAARAGVRSTTRDESGRLILGDIIIELAGEQIQDSSDLYRTLDKLSVGETVDVTLLRGVDKVSARVTLDDVKDMKPPTASTIVIPMRTKKSPNSPY